METAAMLVMVEDEVEAAVAAAAVAATVAVAATRRITSAAATVIHSTARSHWEDLARASLQLRPPVSMTPLYLTQLTPVN